MSTINDWSIPGIVHHVEGEYLTRFRADPKKIRVSIRPEGDMWVATVRRRDIKTCYATRKSPYPQTAVRDALQDMSGNPGVDLDMDWTYNHPWGDLLKVKDEEMSPKKYFIIKNSEGRYYTISPSFEVLWVNDAESAARFDAIRDAVHTANMLDELHGMGFYEPSHFEIVERSDAL